MNYFSMALVSILALHICGSHSQDQLLEGPNVCTRKEEFNITKRVEEQIPRQTKSYVWCFKIPPRCAVYRTQYDTVYTNQVVTETRDVKVCCEGYTASGGKCVAECAQGCARGVCASPGKCHCQPGYTGPSCNATCRAATWGEDCLQNCNCSKYSTCDPRSGKCTCTPGWIGERCDEPCADGKYGPGCSQNCSCQPPAHCSHVTGECICSPGYTGSLCEELCPAGFYGEQCSAECDCLNGASCAPIDGRCSCSPGWTGKRCENRCEAGTYGEYCQKHCDCHNSAVCDNINGSCICPPGYMGSKCTERCLPGRFGRQCAERCDCEGGGCDQVTGRCSAGDPSHLRGFTHAGVSGKCGCYRNCTKIVRAKALTEQESLIYKYVTDGDYKSLSDLCANEVDAKIADINSNHRTPLHLAAEKGCVLTLLTVIGCGAYINAADKDGNTPIHQAVLSNQLHIASVLLYSEADPFNKNRNGKTAYQLAMESENEWFKYIFQNDRFRWYQKVRALKNDEKKLHYNVRKGYYGNVADLCIAGVDAQVADYEHNCNTAMHVAALHAQNVTPMIFTLIRCGVDVNARNANGDTPLHLAVIKGHLNATITLLHFRANSFLKNNDGDTAYQLAKQSGDPGIKASFSEPQLRWYLNST